MLFMEIFAVYCEKHEKYTRREKRSVSEVRSRCYKLSSVWFGALQTYASNFYYYETEDAALD
jgi:hypothetical protein